MTQRQTDIQSNNNAADPLVLGKRYLDLLLDLRRQDALALIMGAAESGLPVPTIYLEVLQPVMYELGRLWQTNEIDIGTEHYCTAATQLLMAHLFPKALEQERVSLSMVGCCVGSELHEMGMRMVCDFFEFEGWDTYFMGANTPGMAILDTLKSHPSDVLCLSATMFYGVSMIRDLVRTLRVSLGPDCPRIMVGGLPFIINPHLGLKVGADATAKGARQAVSEALRLVGR